MNTPNNPFVLPGFGQTGETAANPMMASLEMMQQAWAGLAGPGGLTQAAAFPMNLEDLDRRITELRTVENWLKLNQSMLSSTIQGMEVQRATLATLQSFAGAAATSTPSDASAASDSSSTSAADATQSATQAWWNLMQQQFGQLAGAAASSMGAASAAAESSASAAAPAASTSSTQKAPAKRTAAPRKRSATPAAKSTKKSA